MNYKENELFLRFNKWTKRRGLKAAFVVFLAAFVIALTTFSARFPSTDIQTSAAEVSPMFYILMSDDVIHHEQYSRLENWQALSNGKFNLGEHQYAVVRVTIEKGVLSSQETWPVALFRNNIFSPVELLTLHDYGTSRVTLQAVNDNNKILAAEIPSNTETTTYYISLSGRYLRGQLHLLPGTELTKRINTASSLNAAFLGFVIVFILLGLLAWLLYRQTVFLLYSLLQTSLTLWIAAGEGVLSQLLPNAASMSFFSANALGLVYFICLATFSQRFLGLNKNAVKLHQMLTVEQFVLTAFWCVFCVSYNTANDHWYQTLYGAALITSLAVLFTVFYGAIKNVKAGNEMGYFFLAGMSVMLFFCLLAGLSIGAVIDYRADWGFIKVGALVEMCCLAVGLMTMQSRLLKKQQALLRDYADSTEQLRKTKQAFSAYAQDQENRASKPITELLSVFEHLLFVKAFGNYSIAYHLGSKGLKELVVDISLSRIEEILRDDGLVRCHKSYLVSTNMDFTLVRRTSADYSLALDSHTVPVGRKYQSTIKPIFV